jgi:hypothetical protein
VISRRIQDNLRHVLVGTFIAAAAGCAGNIAETRDSRAAGEWNVRLPTSASPVASFGYGRGGNSTPAPQLNPEPQPLMASATTPRRERPHAQPQPVVRTAPAPKSEASTTVLAQAETPTVAAPAAPAAVSQPVEVAQADPSLQQRYGSRQARKLEQFKGGDLIVIGAGTLVIVLIVVLLLVLLI